MNLVELTPQSRAGQRSPEFGQRLGAIPGVKKHTSLPGARQRPELRIWFNAARYAYNQTVELLTGDDPPRTVKTQVRDIILPALPPWHRSAPREVLVGVIFDACRAVSAAKKRNAQIARDKSADGNFARVRFRSRKSPRQVLTVQANCVSDQGIYRTKLGDMQNAEKLPVAVN